MYSSTFPGTTNTNPNNGLFTVNPSVYDRTSESIRPYIRLEYKNAKLKVLKIIVRAGSNALPPWREGSGYGNIIFYSEKIRDMITCEINCCGNIFDYMRNSSKYVERNRSPYGWSTTSESIEHNKNIKDPLFWNTYCSQVYIIRYNPLYSCK